MTDLLLCLHLVYICIIINIFYLISEDTMKTLHNQNEEQKSNHQIILQDLMNIQLKAQDTIDKLGI